MKLQNPLTFTRRHIAELRHALRVVTAVIAAFAFGFHALVWLSGTLYVAMAVHIAYDITAGIQYGKLGREFGYLHDGKEPQTLASA